MSFSDTIEQFEHEIDSPDFEQHDKYNFEVTLDVFPSEEKKDIFLLEMYGFIPRSLQINEQTYFNSDFYNDLNIYTRYKTPKISLKALLNPKISLSPLNRISSWIEDPNIKPSKILYEIRMFGAIARVNIRNQLEVYGSILKLSELNFDEKHYIDFLSQLKALQERIRSLSHQIYHSVLSPGLKNAFNYVSQFIFVQIELRMSKFLKKHGSKLSLILKNDSIEIVEKVRKEKNLFNPKIELDFTKSGDKFEYSEGLLKKFSQRVLYLQQVRQKKEKQWKQLMYSIAAGIAMVVSILLTIFIVSKFQENSLPFVVGIVVIYMFKDRIKWFVQWLSKRTLRIFIPDRTHKIYDPYEKTYIGIMRETMRFLEEEEIPEIIRNLRNKYRSEIENQENLEVVFRYKKIMQLKSNLIAQIHNRVQNVHDIVRFNVKNLIQYADDPYKQYPIISREDPSGNQIVRQYKVYHLNLIFKVTRLTSKKEQESFFKQVRIILDQNGIKKMEEI
jgi:hypothetical protein